MIYIIGFMGVGKTTISKKLATKLNIPHIDIDQEIERIEKKSISQIFKINGEKYFRSIESEVLKAIEKNHIVSCGGGTILFNNMKYIKSKGISIYLKASPELLFKRLTNNKKNRPLINTINNKELKKFIKETLLRRKEIYEQATYTVDIDGKTIDQILGDIDTLINPF